MKSDENISELRATIRDKENSLVELTNKIDDNEKDIRRLSSEIEQLKAGISGFFLPFILLALP